MASMEVPAGCWEVVCIYRLASHTLPLLPPEPEPLGPRSPALQRSDDQALEGRSLEPLMHGWALPPVHSELYFADIGHAAVRSQEWKLIGPVDAPWRLQESEILIFALGEDPGEHNSLARSAPLGPIGSGLLTRLRGRLNQPESKENNL